MAEILLREMFAEGFHTYWRKGSHTTYSSVIWNLIHALRPEIWGSFCKHVNSKIGEIACEKITAADIKRAITTWEPNPELRDKDRHLAVSFKCLIEMMDANEL